MQLSNVQNIGTTFKKENIFIATLLVSKEDTRRKLGGKFSKDELAEKEFFEKMVKSRIITLEEVDIFYKDENGYTRFDDDGPETFVGDDSDEKGLIQNVVPIWEYYSEDELKEVLVNNTFVSIAVATIEPLEKYNDDYNG